MKRKIALIPGDGIGPEIVKEAKKVLDKVCEVYGHEFVYEELLLGASIDAHGVPLTQETIEKAKSSDAVLMALSEEMQRPLRGISWSRPKDRKQVFWVSERL